MKYIYSAFVIVAFSALSTTSTFAETFGYIPDASIYLGGGFDPLYPQRVFPQCIKSTAECQLGKFGSNTCVSSTGGTQQSTEKFGVTTTFTVKQIQSKYEFFKEVNISLSLSGSYGPFSASGNFSSFAMDEVKEDSLTWMVSAKSHYGSFGLQAPDLLDSDKKLRPVELLGKCGVSYVSQVDRGVIAAAVFSVYNLDEKHKREIHAKLSAGFSAGFNAGGTAAYDEIVRTAMQYGSMSIRIYTVGGEGAPSLSSIIERDPTDLKEIKAALRSYVEKQDVQHAAIIGFRTTGLGKLIGDPSIDPDQSNYAYFLETANRFRLQLIDGLSRVDQLLSNQADFDPSVVNKTYQVRENLGCELRYVETKLQACRLSYDIVRGAMTDGSSNNDKAASLALSYGMASGENSGIRLCSQPQRALDVAAKTSPITFTPMGWSVDSDLAEGVEGDNKNVNACKIRIDEAQRGYAAMLASASNKSDICIQGCDLVTNPNILQDVKILPILPFEVRYWFDFGAESFGSKHNPGLYLVVYGGARITQVRYYLDGQTDPFAINSESGASTINEFVPMGSINGKSVRVEFVTQSGNSYEVIVPRVSSL